MYVGYYRVSYGIVINIDYIISSYIGLQSCIWFFKFMVIFCLFCIFFYNYLEDVYVEMKFKKNYRLIVRFKKY